MKLYLVIIGGHVAKIEKLSDESNQAIVGDALDDIPEFVSAIEALPIHRLDIKIHSLFENNRLGRVSYEKGHCCFEDMPEAERHENEPMYRAWYCNIWSLSMVEYVKGPKVNVYGAVWTLLNQELAEGKL